MCRLKMHSSIMSQVATANGLQLAQWMNLFAYPSPKLSCFMMDSLLWGSLNAIDKWLHWPEQDSKCHPRILSPIPEVILKLQIPFIPQGLVQRRKHQTHKPQCSLHFKFFKPQFQKLTTWFFFFILKQTLFKKNGYSIENLVKSSMNRYKMNIPVQPIPHEK